MARRHPSGNVFRKHRETSITRLMIINFPPPLRNVSIWIILWIFRGIAKRIIGFIYSCFVFRWYLKEKFSEFVAGRLWLCRELIIRQNYFLSLERKMFLRWNYGSKEQEKLLNSNLSSGWEKIRNKTKWFRNRFHFKSLRHVKFIKTIMQEQS